MTVLYNVRHVQIQLHGVAAPDRKEPLGKEALRFTSRLIKRKSVKVRPFSLDGNRRVLARIHVGKKCLNEEILRAGLGKWVRTGPPHDKRLKRLEAEAKKARRGLWKAPGN